jgi:hypothetical protein
MVVQLIEVNRTPRCGPASGSGGGTGGIEFNAESPKELGRQRREGQRGEDLEFAHPGRAAAAEPT